MGTTAPRPHTEKYFISIIIASIIKVTTSKEIILWVEPPCDLKKKLMKVWLCRAGTVSYAHYEASKYNKTIDRRYVRAIIPLTILALTLSNVEVRSVDILYLTFSAKNIDSAIAALSVFVVILSMFHYSKRSRDNSHKHSLAASEYSELKREIEVILTQDDIKIDTMMKIKSKMDTLATWCPTLENAYASDITDGYRGSIGDVKATEADFLSKLGIKIKTKDKK